ncbi:hypothetical protein AX16_002169 [Volvariella volvacea WC 439]|nr:hypothetical protein AX16_002169 [Volvariella volvacea WC 439]
MQHLESLIQAIPPAVFAAGGANFLNHIHHQGVETPTTPIAPFGYPSMQFPSGVPPPSLHVFPLTNPSNHFHDPKQDGSSHSPSAAFNALFSGSSTAYPANSMTPPDQLSEETSKNSLSASYLYFDDEGHTRWQGETSGLPVLDLLLERHGPPNGQSLADISRSSNSNNNANNASSHHTPAVNTDWFPNRAPRRTTDINPQTLWRLITAFIPPDLMDSLVQCYLSTSYYLLPFLHVPTFLADYGNPQKWGEPGFAAFIVAICCLSSRHMDDPRVRADPNDGISAGTQWFELLHRLRTLPIADRPTLYNIQANLIGAVYGVGLGRLSKAAALLGEAVTMCIDAGLHRSADTYDVFDAIEEEVRKRTFWCVYIWDKQLSAHFGRPPVIRFRDCDVGEPAQVDDEFITKEGIITSGSPPPAECRLAAFVLTLRIMVVLESVLDLPPPRQEDPSSFMYRAAALLCGSGNARRAKQLKEEEAMLDEIHRTIPPYWAHTPDTLASDDTIRFTQAQRLHCAEQFVRLLIHRHRFSEMIADRHHRETEMGVGASEEQTEVEKEALAAAHSAALQLIASHLHIAKKGLMTYYGVHVIHQLTQAGRTLVAVLLCCKTDALQHLIPPGLDALRSCVGLLRRFSGRYVCGQRSGDLMEEFCRLTQIPLDLPSNPSGTNSSTGTGTGPSHTSQHSQSGVHGINGSGRPAWIRPVRKKACSTSKASPKFMNGANGSIGVNSGGSAASDSAPSQHSSPEGFSPSDFFSVGVDTKPHHSNAPNPSTPANSNNNTSANVPPVSSNPFGIGFGGFNGVTGIGGFLNGHGPTSMLSASKIPTNSHLNGSSAPSSIATASSPPAASNNNSNTANGAGGSLDPRRMSIDASNAASNNGTNGPGANANPDDPTQMFISMSPVDMMALFESAASANAASPSRSVTSDHMDVSTGLGLFGTEPFGLQR